MTVPADPPDAQILAEYQRRIDQGEPVPSQRHLVAAYGIGFSRAKRLVEELRRRKATAALEAVQTSGDGAVAALATEVIGRIHQHAADADPVQSVQGAPGRTEGAPVDEAEPVHRTGEVDADPVQSVQGAPGRTEGAPVDEAEPVHRTGEVDADPVQSVQGAPGRTEGAPVDEAEPVHRTGEVDADPVQSVQGAPGRTEGAPVDEAEPVHRTGEVDADPVQSVQGAPGRTEGAPVDEAEPVHRTGEVDADPVQSVQGAPATGELAQQPRPANNGSSPGDHTSPGMNGRERPFQTPLRRMLAHDAVEIAAGGAEVPSMSPAPGRTEGAPAGGEVPVHRTGEVDADPVQSVQGAPVDEAEPVHRTGEVDADPVRSVQGAPAGGEVPVQGAPPRTAGGAERTDSEGQTGAAAPPVHRPAPQGAPLAGAAGAAGAVRPGALVIVLWAVGAAVAAAAVTRAAQTPVGARVWEWLTGAVGADAAMVAGVAGGAGALAAVIGLTVHLLARFRAVRAQVGRTPSAWSSRMYLVAAAVFMGLSVDTSLRFFREKVGITEWWELALVFSGMELGLLACAVAMYEAVRAGKSAPQSARMTAWGIAALAGTTGLLLGGWPGGLIRAAGPFLAMVMLHMALGIERRRASQLDMSSALGRILAELRERALSRVGLSDEGRSAVVRSRQRAARRAAQLALQTPDEGDPRARQKRDRALQKELAKADVARDAEARQVFLDEVEVLRAISSVDGLVKTVSALGQDT